MKIRRFKKVFKGEGELQYLSFSQDICGKGDFSFGFKGSQYFRYKDLGTDSIGGKWIKITVEVLEEEKET